MISIDGYECIKQPIYKSQKSSVYKAIDRLLQRPVILKIYNQDFPSIQDLMSYRKEYQITKSLRVKGAISSYSLIEYKRSLVIVFEDFGGQSLDLWLAKRKVNLEEFLDLAIKITKALGEIHNANIIHKDINPSNIVYNHQTGELKIIDFGICSNLSKETQTLKTPQLLEGTLEYISPEQTGRINRTIDYRTDFYSLGITLYELLIRNVPFIEKDPLELVYAHLVKNPAPLSELNSEIPQIISDIVMKLLSKDPQERYQSVWGIISDLQRCLDRLNCKQNIVSFPLATQDMSYHLQIPEKLYGREKELRQLLKTFDRIADKNNQEARELMLISGSSGIGKSTLVREIYKSVSIARGFFISGKYDQYQANSPYSGIIQALRLMMGYLLKETDFNLKIWSESLQEALGDNGQVIIEEIPELEIIIGKQPSVPSLDAKESQNRFILAFENLIKTLARPDHPLVLFLDDLQWIDNSSLELLETMITSSEINHLLVIGVYRNNEVNEFHRLSLKIDLLQKAGVILNRIVLLPLQKSALNQLLADTLKCNTEKTETLADLIDKITGGNPFFVNLFLQSIYENKLLYFDRQKISWQWNVAEIKTKNVPNNVVNLLINKINKFHRNTQEALKFASCIGNQFLLTNLAIVSKKTLQEVAIALQEAIANGLIVPLNNDYKSIELNLKTLPNQQIEYKFVHDRIQQAANLLIPKPDRAKLHWQIGKLLLKNIPVERREEKIFDIVSQFNFAKSLINSKSERKELIQLNLIAGIRAKNSAAYESAFNFFKLAIDLLDKDSWKSEYNLNFKLYLEGAEAAYLTNSFQFMTEWLELLLIKAKNLTDKVKVYQLKIDYLHSKGQHFDALKTGVFFLNELKFKIYPFSIKLSILCEILKIKWALKNRDIQELIDIPMVTNPRILAILTITQSILECAYITDSQLYALIILKRLNLLIRYGNYFGSGSVYAGSGILFCGILGDINYGDEFGKLALSSLNKFNGQKTDARVLLLVNGFIKHWTIPLEEIVPSLLNAYHYSLQIGNIKYASYSIFFYCGFSYFIGSELNNLEKEMNVYSQSLVRLKQETSLKYLNIFHKSVLNLINITDSPWILKENLTKNDKTGSFIFHLNQMILAYLFNRYEEALENLKLAKSNLRAVSSTLNIPIFYFYYSLINTAILSNFLKKSLLKEIDKNQKKMKKWADFAPKNFLDKYYLVEAERNRILGNKIKAMEFYDKAIKEADSNEYFQDKALACELAGNFYFQWGMSKIAETYIIDAWCSYKKWGAISKVKHLEEKFSELFQDILIKLDVDNIRYISPKSSASFKLETIDIDFLIETDKIISNEENLETLLSTILTYALKVVAAETGLIILPQAEKDFIKRKAKRADDRIIILPSGSISSTQEFPQSIVDYARHSKQTVILNNASTEGLFIKDPYIRDNKSKSIICLPLLSQAKFVGVIYLENNLVTDSFKQEYLGLLKLITTQAAISIENAILKNKKHYVSQYYKLGGSLKADFPSYVTREADEQLYQNLIIGNHCYILNARQMGKSSLRVRVTARLESEGYRCVFIDLASIGYNEITRKKWYAGLIFKFIVNFSELKDFDLSVWLEKLSFIDPATKFNYFFEKIFLAAVKQKIVIFLEEIDSIRSLRFDMNDLFKQIRYFEDHRADNIELNRVCFCLIGSARPDSLTDDNNLIPFNTAIEIPLYGFKLEETKPLIIGFENKCENPENVMREILIWTGGQPMLTQKICYLIEVSNNNISSGNENEKIEFLVKNKIIKDWRTKDTPRHFKTIEQTVLKNRLNSNKLLHFYQNILQSDRYIADNKSPEQYELLVIGLIKQVDNKLEVFNRIYREIFNLDWIEKNLK